MGNKTETARERQLRQHIEYDTGQSNVKPETYRAPNGTVPKTAAPPAKTKTLGEAFTAVKGLFSDDKPKKKGR